MDRPFVAKLLLTGSWLVIFGLIGTDQFNVAKTWITSLLKLSGQGPRNVRGTKAQLNEKWLTASATDEEGYLFVLRQSTCALAVNTPYHCPSYKKHARLDNPKKIYNIILCSPSLVHTSNFEWASKIFTIRMNTHFAAKGLLHVSWIILRQAHSWNRLACLPTPY